MVCNLALLVRNQTVFIMSLHSLYHYHAEWPLMTELWINACGYEPTVEVIQAALLLLHPATTSTSSSGPLQWISRSLFGPAPRSEGSSAGTGSTSRGAVSTVSWPCSKTQGHRHFYPLVLLQWQFETLPWVSEWFSFSVITDTSLKAWGSRAYPCSNPTAIKALFKIKSACSAMLLPPPPVQTSSCYPETNSILMTTGC